MNFFLFYLGIFLLAVWTVWFLLKRPRKAQKRIYSTPNANKHEADTLAKESNEDSEGDGLMSEGDIMFPPEDDSEDD